MIVPHKLAQKLGSEIMNSLVVNQRRLVAFEDLHYALLSLLDHRSPSESQEAPKGLFAPVSLNRTCYDLKLDSDVLCLCKGMEQIVANNSYNVLWAAEFALGSLNNRIQGQRIASLESKHAEHVWKHTGRGACQRYAGGRMARARQRNDGDNETPVAFTHFRAHATVLI